MCVRAFDPNPCAPGLNDAKPSARPFIGASTPPDVVVPAERARLCSGWVEKPSTRRIAFAVLGRADRRRRNGATRTVGVGGGRARWWARPRRSWGPLRRRTGRDRGTRVLRGRTDVVRLGFTPRWHSRPERWQGTAHDDDNENENGDGTRPEAVSYARAGRTGRSQQYA